MNHTQEPTWASVNLTVIPLRQQASRKSSIKQPSQSSGIKGLHRNKAEVLCPRIEQESLSEHDEYRKSGRSKCRRKHGKARTLFGHSGIRNQQPFPESSCTMSQFTEKSLPGGHRQNLFRRNALSEDYHGRRQQQPIACYTTTGGETDSQSKAKPVVSSVLATAYSQHKRPSDAPTAPPAVFVSAAAPSRLPSSNTESQARLLPDDDREWTEQNHLTHAGRSDARPIRGTRQQRNRQTAEYLSHTRRRRDDTRKASQHFQPGGNANGRPSPAGMAQEESILSPQFAQSGARRLPDKLSETEKVVRWLSEQQSSGVLFANTQTSRHSTKRGGEETGDEEKKVSNDQETEVLEIDSFTLYAKRTSLSFITDGNALPGSASHEQRDEQRKGTPSRTASSTSIGTYLHDVDSGCTPLPEHTVISGTKSHTDINDIQNEYLFLCSGCFSTTTTDSKTRAFLTQPCIGLEEFCCDVSSNPHKHRNNLFSRSLDDTTSSAFNNSAAHHSSVYNSNDTSINITAAHKPNSTSSDVMKSTTTNACPSFQGSSRPASRSKYEINITEKPSSRSFCKARTGLRSCKDQILNPPSNQAEGITDEMFNPLIVSKTNAADLQCSAVNTIQDTKLYGGLCDTHIGAITRSNLMPAAELQDSSFSASTFSPSPGLKNSSDGEVCSLSSPAYVSAKTKPSQSHAVMSATEPRDSLSANTKMISARIPSPSSGLTIRRELELPTISSKTPVEAKTRLCQTKAELSATKPRDIPSTYTNISTRTAAMPSGPRVMKVGELQFISRHTPVHDSTRPVQTQTVVTFTEPQDSLSIDSNTNARISSPPVGQTTGTDIQLHSVPSPTHVHTEAGPYVSQVVVSAKESGDANINARIPSPPPSLTTAASSSSPAARQSHAPIPPHQRKRKSGAFMVSYFEEDPATAPDQDVFTQRLNELLRTTYEQLEHCGDLAEQELSSLALFKDDHAKTKNVVFVEDDNARSAAKSEHSYKKESEWKSDRDLPPQDSNDSGSESDDLVRIKPDLWMEDVPGFIRQPRVLMQGRAAEQTDPSMSGDSLLRTVPASRTYAMRTFAVRHDVLQQQQQQQICLTKLTDKPTDVWMERRRELWAERGVSRGYVPQESRQRKMTAYKNVDRSRKTHRASRKRDESGTSAGEAQETQMSSGSEDFNRWVCGVQVLPGDPMSKEFNRIMTDETSEAISRWAKKKICNTSGKVWPQESIGPPRRDKKGNYQQKDYIELKTARINDCVHYHKKIYGELMQIAKAETAKRARRRWFRAQRLVFILNKFLKSAAESTFQKEKRKHKDFHIRDKQGVDAIVAEKEAKKPSDVKKDNFRLTTEGMRVLKMQPKERTEEEILNALSALQHSRTFCSLPVDVQHQLARCGSLLIVGVKQVIVRAGNPASHFYIILTGQAQAYKDNQNLFLNAGETFGSEGMLEDGVVPYTVICRIPMLLLTLTKRQFIAIFVCDHSADELPSHMKLLSQQEWMRGWPVHKLLLHPSQCFEQYVRRGTVIVTDSEQSELLYVVKSGLCDVYMRIDGTSCTWRDLARLMPEDGSSLVDHLQRKEDGLLRQKKGMVPRSQMSQMKHHSKAPVLQTSRPSSHRWCCDLNPKSSKLDAISHDIYYGRCSPETLRTMSAHEKKPPRVDEPPIEPSSRSHDVHKAMASTAAKNRHESMLRIVPLRSGSKYLRFARTPESDSRASPVKLAKAQSSPKALAVRTTTPRPGTAPESSSAVSVTGLVPKGSSTVSLAGLVRGSSSKALTIGRAPERDLTVSTVGKQSSCARLDKTASTAAVPSIHVRDDRMVNFTVHAVPPVRKPAKKKTRVQKPTFKVYLGNGRPIPVTDWYLDEVRNSRQQKSGEESALDRRKRYKGRLPLLSPKPPLGSPYAKTSAPFFAKIRTLQKGDVFGLDDLSLDLLEAAGFEKTTAKRALVSCGAEIVGLNKKYFCSNADQNVQQRVLLYNLRQHKYPSNFCLQQSHRLATAWQLYQDKMADAEVKNVCHALKNHGIYFQTGPLVDPKASVDLIADTR